MLPTVRPRPLRELPRRKCSTGCPVLDAFLGGGLPCGQLIEITGGLAGLAGVELHMLHMRTAVQSMCAGEPAAAKTQLCLQLLLNTQKARHLGGLEGSALCALL